MLIRFDPLKVTQAAAVLLKREPRECMGRVRLLKLLYIADRESIQEVLRPITGDLPVAMKYGPVLSRTYDLMKGEDIHNDVWDQFIGRDGHTVLLVKDPGNSKLNRHELRKLAALSERYAGAEDFELAEVTHAFQEWVRNKPEGNGMNRIPLDDLLTATGLQNHKAYLEEQQSAEAAFQRVFG